VEGVDRSFLHGGAICDAFHVCIWWLDEMMRCNRHRCLVHRQIPCSLSCNVVKPSARQVVFFTRSDRFHFMYMYVYFHARARLSYPMHAYIIYISWYSRVSVFLFHENACISFTTVYMAVMSFQVIQGRPVLLRLLHCNVHDHATKNSSPT
jgi:hypothetical protein